MPITDQAPLKRLRRGSESYDWDDPDAIDRVVGLESECQSVQIVASEYVPSFLRSEEYAEEFLRSAYDSPLPKTLVALRERRTRSRPGLKQLVVLHEDALRQPVGGADLKAQINYLLEHYLAESGSASEQRVELRLLLNSSEASKADCKLTFSVIDDAVAVVDSGPFFTVGHEPRFLRKWRDRLARLLEHALSDPVDIRRHLLRIREEVPTPSTSLPPPESAENFWTDRFKILSKAIDDVGAAPQDRRVRQHEKCRSLFEEVLLLPGERTFAHGRSAEQFVEEMNQLLQLAELRLRPHDAPDDLGLLGCTYNGDGAPSFYFRGTDSTAFEAKLTEFDVVSIADLTKDSDPCSSESVKEEPIADAGRIAERGAAAAATGLGEALWEEAGVKLPPANLEAIARKVASTTLAIVNRDFAVECPDCGESTRLAEIASTFPAPPRPRSLDEALSQCLNLKARISGLQDVLTDVHNAPSLSVEDLSAFTGVEFDSVDMADAFAGLARALLERDDKAFLCHKHQRPSSIVCVRSSAKGQFQFSHLDYHAQGGAKMCGGGARVPDFQLVDRPERRRKRKR